MKNAYVSVLSAALVAGFAVVAGPLDGARAVWSWKAGGLVVVYQNGKPLQRACHFITSNLEPVKVWRKAGNAPLMNGVALAETAFFGKDVEYYAEEKVDVFDAYAFMLPNLDSSRDALHWDWGGNRKLARRVAGEILFRLGRGPDPSAKEPK